MIVRVRSERGTCRVTLDTDSIRPVTVHDLYEAVAKELTLELANIKLSTKFPGIEQGAYPNPDPDPNHNSNAY